MNFNDTVRIQVYVELPWSSKEIRPYSYAIDGKLVRESLAPLPRDREIDPWSASQAQRQSERRRDMVEMISRDITLAILNACEDEDTDHGYPKDNQRRGK